MASTRDNLADGAGDLRVSETAYNEHLSSQGRWARFLNRAINPLPRLSNLGVAAIALAVAALLSVLLTYLTFSGAAPFGNSRGVLLALLIVNLCIVLAIAPIIAWRIIQLWLDRRRGVAASKLHFRLVSVFSVIAIFPAIIVAIFSAVTLTVSLNALLGEPVPTAIANSATMARYYVDEKLSTVNEELRAMGVDVNNNAQLFKESPIRFGQFLEIQASLRHLSAAYVVDGSGTPLAKAEQADAPTFAIPAPDIMEQARQGRYAIFSDVEKNSQFRGIVRLTSFDDAFLIISLKIDNRVVDHLNQMQTFIDEFAQVESNRAFIEMIFALTYVLIALIVLLGAIWLGLRAATSMSAPVGRLVTAAEQVSEGDLTARVTENDADDEVGTLSRTFNRMTGQLQSQRNELIEANTQMDRRRRFTEAVLGGVSAGVLGLDNVGKIEIANRSALKLMNLPREKLVGSKLIHIIPEMTDLINRATTQKEGFVADHLHLTTGDVTRHFNVQVTSDHVGRQDGGYVVTFDDITRLVSAQRTAAWADVARRIAHEIKNPLTPIQLSAERLKRKYKSEVVSDPSVFEQCTDTIVRQVKDIGRMVDEFSSFARMPAPVLRPEEIVDLVKKSVFPQRVANPNIEYGLSLPEGEIITECDGRLIGQALTNILKNAAEAIETKTESARGDSEEHDFTGAIDVTLQCSKRNLSICVEDNGCGLPEEARERLTEPYITTRAKGTGLGLAIVKKIMEDHEGSLVMVDSTKLGGAKVQLQLPLKQDEAQSISDKLET